MRASQWVARGSPAVHHTRQSSDVDSFQNTLGDGNASSGVAPSSFTNPWLAEGKVSLHHDSLPMKVNTHSAVSSLPTSPTSASPMSASPLPFSTQKGRSTSENNLPFSSNIVGSLSPTHFSSSSSPSTTSRSSGTITTSLHRGASKDNLNTPEIPKEDALDAYDRFHGRDEKEEGRVLASSESTSLMHPQSTSTDFFSPSLQKSSEPLVVASVSTAATGGTSTCAHPHLSLISPSSKRVTQPKRSVSFYSLGRLCNPLYHSSSVRSTRSILSSSSPSNTAHVPPSATTIPTIPTMAMEDPLCGVDGPRVSMEDNGGPSRLSCGRDDESNASTTSSRSIILKHGCPPSPALHAPPATLRVVEAGASGAFAPPSPTSALRLSATVTHASSHASTPPVASNGVPDDRDPQSLPASSSVLHSSREQVCASFPPRSPPPNAGVEETRPTTAGFLAARQAAPYDRVHQGNRRGLLELLKLRGDVAAMRSKRPVSSQHQSYPNAHPTPGRDAPVYPQMKAREPFHFFSSKAEGMQPPMRSVPEGENQKDQKRDDTEDRKGHVREEKGPLDDGASGEEGGPWSSFTSSCVASSDTANDAGDATLHPIIAPSETDPVHCHAERADGRCSADRTRSHERGGSGESGSRMRSKGGSTGLRSQNVDPHALQGPPVSSTSIKNDTSHGSFSYPPRANTPPSRHERQRSGAEGGGRMETVLPSPSLMTGSHSPWRTMKKPPSSTMISSVGTCATPVAASVPPPASSSLPPSSPTRSFSATCLSPAPWPLASTLPSPAPTATGTDLLSSPSEKSTTKGDPLAPVGHVGKPQLAPSLPMTFRPSSENNVLPSATQEAIQHAVDRRTAAVAAATAVEGGRGASTERNDTAPEWADAEEADRYRMDDGDGVEEEHRTAQLYELTEGEIQDALARQSCDAVGLTPVLASSMPKGRYVLLNMLTTWGDNDEVGICEVEFYNERGESVLWRREREADRLHGAALKPMAEGAGNLLVEEEAPAGVPPTAASAMGTPAGPRALDMGTAEVSVDKVMNMVSITAASVDDSVRLLVEYSATPEDLSLWEKGEAASEQSRGSSPYYSGSGAGGPTSRSGSGKRGKQNSRRSRSTTGVRKEVPPIRLSAAEKRIHDDPRRQIASMIDGVVNTHDESHMLALPYTPGHHHLLCFMFARPICLSMIRIYNYCGRGRAQTFKGVRIAEITMDDEVIFRGEIQRHSGALCSMEEAANGGSPELRNCENILFTEDKATLTRIIAGGACRGSLSTGSSGAAASRASGKEGENGPEEEAHLHAVQEKEGEARREDGRGNHSGGERFSPPLSTSAVGEEADPHVHGPFASALLGTAQRPPPGSSCVVIRQRPVNGEPDEIGMEPHRIWRGGEFQPSHHHPFSSVPDSPTPTSPPPHPDGEARGGPRQPLGTTEHREGGESVPPSSPLPDGDVRLRRHTPGTPLSSEVTHAAADVDRLSGRGNGSANPRGQREGDAASLASSSPSASSPDRPLHSRAHRVKHAQYPSQCPSGIRSICFLFLATWGDPTHIGLSGLRFRTASGQLIEEAVCAWRVQYPDGAYNTLEDSAAFTEQIGFLFDENPRTACTLPFMSGMQLVIVFDRPIPALGFLEVANYSVGDTTYCGVKEVRLFLSQGEPPHRHPSGGPHGKGEEDDRCYNFGIAEKEIERFRALWTFARLAKSRALLVAGKVSEVTPACGVSLRKAPARLSVPRFQTYDLSLQVGAAGASNAVDAWGEATDTTPAPLLPLSPKEEDEREKLGEEEEARNGIFCSIAVGPGTGGDAMDVECWNGAGGGGGIGYCASSFANSLNASMNIRAAMAMRRARMALRERPEWLLQYQPYITPLLPVGYVCKVKLHICAKDVEGRHKLQDGGGREESLAGDRPNPRKRLVTETLKAFMREWVVDPFHACAFANDNGENIRPVPVVTKQKKGRMDGGGQPPKKGSLPHREASSSLTGEKGRGVGRETASSVRSTLSSAESPLGASRQSNLQRWQRQKPTTAESTPLHNGVSQPSLSLSSSWKTVSSAEDHLETEKSLLEQRVTVDEAALHSEEEEEEEEEEGACYLPIVAESVIRPLPPPITPYQDRHALEVSMELMYVADTPFCLAVLCLNAPLVYNGSAAWVKRVQVFMDDSMIFDSGDAGISLSKTCTRPSRISLSSPHSPPSSVLSLFSHRQGKDKLENRRKSSLCSPLAGAQKINESPSPSFSLHSPRSLRQNNEENNLSNPIERLKLLPPCVSSIHPYILFTLDHNVLEEVKNTVSEMLSSTQ